MNPDATPALTQINALGRRLFMLWCIITAAAIAALAWGFGAHGRSFFYSFQGPADASLVEVKFLVFILAWTLLGFALWLTRWRALLLRHGLFVIVWLLIALGYLNIVRGPHKAELVDFPAYFLAAERMNQGLPLLDTTPLYLYPPLTATVLGPLVRFGLGPASWLFRFGNYAALLLFAGLLYAALQRIGTSRTLAAVLTLAALTANVPIGDTLFAQQVDLHVANLILGAFLLFPRREALSAASLALGMHVKVFPALLVLPFLYLRRWRWLIWFAAVAVAVVIATSAVNSFAYYGAFLQKAGSLTEAGIRNVSGDAIIHNVARFSGWSLGAFERPFGIAARLLLGGLATWWGLAAMRAGALMRNGTLDERVIGSSIASLSFVMLLVSPSIWIHHCVFVLFPALVILLALPTAADLFLFGVAYFLVFLVPVNEIFPFAYLRLVGLLTLAALLHRVHAGARTSQPRPMERLEARLARAFDA